VSGKLGNAGTAVFGDLVMQREHRPVEGDGLSPDQE
jgi:hypothetical protein